MMARLRFLLPMAALLWAIPAHAVEPPTGSEIQIYIENDMLSGSDRYYTNGIKLGLGAAEDIWPAPMRAWLEAAYDWAGGEPGGRRHDQGFFLGQNMYSPRDIRIAVAQPNDRPWAAWLYAGWVLQRHTPGPRPILDTVELDLGAVGPAALGKQVQKGWHRLIGAPEPRGWAHQIRNEPGFMLSYLKKTKFGGDSLDLVPHWGATVGTVMTFARAGAVLRVGRHLSGFGPDSIEPGGAMLQPQHGGSGPLEHYGFLGFDARAVAHNIFLDGGFFRDNPGVDRRPLVRDLTLGVSVRYGRTRVSFTRLHRSEEFSTSAGGGGKQRFDSVNLGLEF